MRFEAFRYRLHARLATTNIPQACFVIGRDVAKPLLTGLILLALLPTPDVDAQSLMEGVRRYEAGDYAGAIREWLPLAEAGDTNALFNLGQVYRLGHGVPADPAMAEVYYRRAAEFEHVEAMSNLATLIYFDDASPDRRNEAITLWQRAAALGDSRAQYMLGALYFNGDGVSQNNIQAYAWTLLAIDGGSVEAVESGKTIRKYLSEREQREAASLAPTLLDREAIEARRSIMPSSAATRSPPTASVAQPPTSSAALLLDFSRPPDDLDEASQTSMGVEPDPDGAQSRGKETAGAPPPADLAQTPVVETGDVNQPEQPVASPEVANEPDDGMAGDAASTETPEAAARDGNATAELNGNGSTPSAQTKKDSAADQQANYWSVQLGAFREIGAARRELDRLASGNSEILNGIQVAIIRADLGASRGVYYRLRGGTFARRSEADSLCRRLIENGAPCVVVAPGN